MYRKAGRHMASRFQSRRAHPKEAGGSHGAPHGTVAQSPLSSAMSCLLASSAGWGGWLPTCHSERHATQGIGSRCSILGRSVLQHDAGVYNSFVGS